MKASLQAGIRYVHTLTLPVNKTVPHLYPEAAEFQIMPEVFATGFMVGFLEWACICAINPHIDWPTEQTLGTHINVSHEAATPPGLTVTATVELLEVQGRRLFFSVQAHDGHDLIAQGTHERFIVNKQVFETKLQTKRLKGLA